MVVVTFCFSRLDFYLGSWRFFPSCLRWEMSIKGWVCSNSIIIVSASTEEIKIHSLDKAVWINWSKLSDSLRQFPGWPPNCSPMLSKQSTTSLGVLPKSRAMDFCRSINVLEQPGPNESGTSMPALAQAKGRHVNNDQGPNTNSWVAPGLILYMILFSSIQLVHWIRTWERLGALDSVSLAMLAVRAQWALIGLRVLINEWYELISWPFFISIRCPVISIGSWGQRVIGLPLAPILLVEVIFQRI